MFQCLSLRDADAGRVPCLGRRGQPSAELSESLCPRPLPTRRPAAPDASRRRNGVTRPLPPAKALSVSQATSQGRPSGPVDAAPVGESKRQGRSNVVFAPHPHEAYPASRRSASPSRLRSRRRRWRASIRPTCRVARRTHHSRPGPTSGSTLPDDPRSAAPARTIVVESAARRPRGCGRLSSAARAPLFVEAEEAGRHVGAEQASALGRQTAHRPGHGTCRRSGSNAPRTAWIGGIDFRPQSRSSRWRITAFSAPRPAVAVRDGDGSNMASPQPRGIGIGIGIGAPRRCALTSRSSDAPRHGTLRHPRARPPVQEVEQADTEPPLRGDPERQGRADQPCGVLAPLPARAVRS